MSNKTIGGIIPIRIRIPWRRDKPTRMPHDGSMAAGLFVSLPTPALSTFPDLLARDQQLSTAVPSTTSQGLSFRNFSDGAQIALPVAQGAVAAIPAVGPPLAAAISGILAVLKVINTSNQNREALDSLTCQLYALHCHLANAPIPRTPIEETNRRALTKVLEDTTNELGKMRGCSSWSALLTQDIAGCSNKINNYLLQFTAMSQMQLTDLVHTLLTEIRYTRQGCLPAVMTPDCVVVVDATGEEHRMLLQQCSSFDRLHAFLPGILSECRPDKAHIQKWYIDRDQYDFVIDNGTNVTQLTRESDVWSTIEAGTKIIMRVITTEVSRRLSARYQCHCGKWNEVNGNGAAVLEALEDGFTITCSYCERRFQITVTKGEEVSRKQGEQSQAKDHGPAVEERSLIRNLLKKQVLEEEEFLDPSLVPPSPSLSAVLLLDDVPFVDSDDDDDVDSNASWVPFSLSESESCNSEGEVDNSPHEPELPSPESAHHTLPREETSSAGQERQRQSHDAGYIVHQHQNRYEDGEPAYPRHLQYGQRGRSDHRHGSGQDSRRLGEHTDLQQHQYHHYSHQPLYNPYSPALRAEPQVRASGHRGGEGSYHYREQSGSGSGHGKGSGSGEYEPAPIPAGVTYPVSPVRPPRSLARRCGSTVAKTKAEGGGDENQGGSRETNEGGATISRSPDI